MIYLNVVSSLIFNHKKRNLLTKNRLLISNLCMYGGGRGIRTPARFNPPVGFQDRSLQPDLGIPPYDKKYCTKCIGLSQPLCVLKNYVIFLDGTLKVNFLQLLPIL